jgi:sortase A
MRWAGYTLLGLAGVTALFLVYQLLVTDYFNSRSQATASSELTRVLEIRRAQMERASPDISADAPELLIEPPAPVGDPMGRIVIDKISLDAVMFEGVDRETLRLGPGHMPETPLPGQPGNAVLSGHRTTYGRPFSDLDQLAPGDTIEVVTAIGVNIYEVRQVLVVQPTDLWVTDQVGGAWLTLTTCHPQFSARERLVIQAELMAGPNFDYVQAISAARTGVGLW